MAKFQFLGPMHPVSCSFQFRFVLHSIEDVKENLHKKTKQAEDKIKGIEVRFATFFVYIKYMIRILGLYERL